MNADTKHADLAVAFLNTMATPDMAKLWASTVMGQSGIKADLGEVGGPHAKYLADLEAVNKDAVFFQGQPVQLMRGAARDTFTQVINGDSGGVADGGSGGPAHERGEVLSDPAMDRSAPPIRDATGTEAGRVTPRPRWFGEDQPAGEIVQFLLPAMLFYVAFTAYRRC